MSIMITIPIIGIISLFVNRNKKEYTEISYFIDCKKKNYDTRR